MSGPVRSLRSGFTTGAAAAAAAKAALLLLVAGHKPDQVTIAFLSGGTTRITVHSCQRLAPDKARCTVIKDAGDDPDITHGAEIGASVTLAARADHEARICITGGKGVGVVTKPGLEIPPGQAAITPGPVTMITNSINEVLDEHPIDAAVHVEVFVPEGERLARKTLNARLGIIGGLSILGTTGIVRPMSHEAYVATIEKAMDVARAAGLSHLVLTTGRRSERLAQDRWPNYPEESFIQIGDFFQVALAAAAGRGFASATLAVFFGKAVKMAQNVPHTHAAKSAMTLQTLARWTLERTADRELARRIAVSNTARHAFDPLQQAAPSVVAHVAHQVQASAEGFAAGQLRVRCVIFDYDGGTAVDTQPDWG